MYFISGIGMNYPRYRVLDGEAHEKFTEAMVLVYIDNNETGYVVPLTKYDITTHKTFDASGILKLAVATNRIILPLNGGKKNPVGYGAIRTR
jgi:hypothetical protein